MSKTKSTCPPGGCPVGRFFNEWGASGPRPEKMEAMARCALQVLKAVRLALDEWIETLEKRSRPKTRRRVTKIRVQ